MTQSEPASVSRQFARRLLARDAVEVRDGEPEQVAAALRRTGLRVSANLRDALGEAGSSALLARALARAEADYPALHGMSRQNQGEINLDTVVTVIERHGVAAATAVFESLLAALIDILSRLVGEEMAMQLMDHDASGSHRGGEEQAP
jgi:hypothetical protein